MLRPVFGAICFSLLCLHACGGAPAASAPPEAPADARQAGTIRHVVLLMMENRSFDHFLGWVPGADGAQAGLSFPDATGAMHPTHALAPDYQGCGQQDPDHSYGGGRTEYDGGKNDGWLLVNDAFSIGYYGQADLAYWSRTVPLWTVFDNYHPAILSETFPNRIYQHAGQTDRLGDTFAISSLPTIWDRLAQAGLKGRYYFSDLPFTALWGLKHLGISKLIGQFYGDAAKGELPEVSFIDGSYAQEFTGTGNDDHPHGDIRNGEQFIARVYDAIASSPQWSSTVLIVSFDEWGGFYDHVPPPVALIPPATLAAGDHDGRLGFRVPAMIVSPWARKGVVSHKLYDHTSVLNLIEWNWGLLPLTVRDATANNLADELDFTHPRAAPQPLALPRVHYGSLCLTTPVAPRAEGLQRLARQYGFPEP
ncbi:MAG TPA: alkaline phosphatase family protein [Myxococcales bacterium]|nr:alkaline phosphatase family protein [Myxococcales bacterium]